MINEFPLYSPFLHVPLDPYLYLYYQRARHQQQVVTLMGLEAHLSIHDKNQHRLILYHFPYIITTSHDTVAS